MMEGQPALPSMFQIGDRVLFQPNGTKPVEEGTYAEVLRVAFDQPKVLYDLAITNPADGMPYYAYPLCSVDSTFVYPLPNYDSPAPTTELTDAVGYVDAVMSSSIKLKSESKGSKKKKSPRQLLYSVLMTELAGTRGEELADIMAKGDEDKLKNEFDKMVVSMMKRFKQKAKE